MRRVRKNFKLLLDKSRDSATQAVSAFNDPRSEFRTGNFAVLMCIAWTSLLHSYFEKRKEKYYYKQDNGRYVKIDDEYKAWELSECVKHVFSENDPVRKNIELFVKLRNQIEHRNLPGIDTELIGECQAFVLNFEEFLTREYGQTASLIDTMFMPIQISPSRHPLPKTKSEEKVIGFIRQYRNLLTADVLNSQQFSFKAFLIPKIGNHRSSSDVAIEFVKFDPNNPEEMAKYEKAIIGIKEKLVPVANQNLYRPSAVLAELEKRGTRRSLTWHTRNWQRFNVRPITNAANKTPTKSEFCVYDKAHGDYLYTDAWIDLLAKQK